MCVRVCVQWDEKIVKCSGTQRQFGAYYQAAHCGQMDLRSGPNGQCKSSARPVCGGDLSRLPLGKKLACSAQLEPEEDCILYAMLSSLQFFSYNYIPFINNINSYLRCCDNIFKGKALSLGRACSILLKYFFLETKTLSVSEYNFSRPAICRVGVKGSVGTHVVFICERTIFSLDELPLTGQVIFDCRVFK